MKTNRRDFLKSIAAAAITFATGFAMSAVRVEEAEPTDAEHQYGEMLSREHLYDAEHYVYGSGRIDWEASGINPEDVAPTGDPVYWTEWPGYRVYDGPGEFVNLRWLGGTVWGVTDQAEIYVSLDGGASWTLQEAGTIECVNAKQGGVVPLLL